MSKKIDLTMDSSRPDLEVILRLPGAYIIKNGQLIPDLNDEAMKNRETIKMKRDMPKEDPRPDVEDED